MLVAALLLLRALSGGDLTVAFLPNHRGVEDRATETPTNFAVEQAARAQNGRDPNVINLSRDFSHEL